MASITASGDRVFELEFASRLLIGHGNASATGVGLSVHHTWGVSVILGSALKGLPAHYLDVFFGPANPSLPPWEQPQAQGERAAYQGVIWRDRRIKRGRKRETPIEQLGEELQRCGFPTPIAVHEIPQCELNGRALRWIEFRCKRLLGGGSRGQGLGYGFEIEFSEEVVGPLCLGYSCHFGLGLFITRIV
jgi:CRISPR-associated protein Csb2